MRIRIHHFITSKLHVFFIGMFFFFNLNIVFSQCPTILNPSQTFCDVQSPTVADLVAVDNGNGVLWYSSATATIPLSDGEGLVNGDFYYVDDISGSCGTRASVQVTIYSSPIGQNFQGVCVDIASDATIADLIATGNNVQWYNVPIGGLALPSNTILVDNTIYYASQTNPNTGCETSRLSVFVNVGVVPTPIGDSNQQFCFDPLNPPTVANLVASGNNNWYSTLSSALPLPLSTPLINGQSYFATTVDPPCESASRLEVTVTILQPNNPGISSVKTICQAQTATLPPFNLFDELAGTPDSGGLWTGPLPTTNGSLGTVNVSTLTVAGSPYVFTYTVSSLLCPLASSTVTIVITPAPNAGTNGLLTLCSNAPTQNLFNSLGGTPQIGGTWSPALASGTGFFNPAIDAAGVYTYTVVGISPCANATSTVAVTVIPQANAGVSGNLAICSNSNPQDLFLSLGGSPQAGGTWSPSLASGTGIFNPLVDPAGIYTYTVTGTAPCSNATATVTVTKVLPPNAGTNANLSICSNSAPQNLFLALGGNPQVGGVWSPALASGTGFFNPSIDASGVYTYTVFGTPPCSNSSATVSVTVVPQPNAGVSGVLPLCSNSGPQNLFLILGSTAQAGGTWSPPMASGTGIFNPLIDAAGVYTYTLLGAAPCSNASATVTVSIAPLPNAGTNGSLTICSNAAPQNLFLSLGGNPQIGGTWSPALASGTGIFNPAIDPAGIYSYTINGVPPCSNSTATVTVIIEPLPNAGTSGSAAFCSNSGPQDLFLSLGDNPQPGGTWSPALASGTGIFNPLIDSPGIYTYTTAPSQSCGQSASATVTVTLTATANAGGNGIANLCANNPPTDLFLYLTGNPQLGGIWTPTLASGTGIFNPLIDAPGIYTYTLNNSCGLASANVTVTIAASPNAGGAGASLLINTCFTTIAVDLNSALNGTQDPGTWSDDDNTGALNNNIFNPSLVGPGIYQFTYTVLGPNPSCASNAATVTVIVSPLPDAGTFTGIQNVCSSQATFDLYSLLSGYQLGGVWTDSSGQTVTNPISIINFPANTYSYTYTVSNACGTDSEAVQFVIIIGPNLNGIQINADSICLNFSNEVFISGATNLTDGNYIFEYILSGASNAALSATVNIVGGNGSFIIPASELSNPGSVTVSISQVFSETNSCGTSGNALSPVTFEVLQLGTPEIIPSGNEFCGIDNPTVADLSANIVGNTPVIWYNAAIEGTAYSNTDLLINGTTYYAGYVTTSGCESTSRLAVTVDLTKCPILIPDGFSPNDDGINDDFVINNINIVYPNFDLEIYNRYGNLIYKGNSQTPNWNGTTTASGLKLGNGVLPVGVYFFILNFNDGATQPLQGRIYLSR